VTLTYKIVLDTIKVNLCAKWLHQRSFCWHKGRPHQQRCHSNIVECYKSNDSFECCFDKVERCFDTAAGVDGA